MRSYVSLFLGLLAVQQAAATSWGDCQKLPTCSGACNQCTDQQKSGLDFSKAPSGPIANYGGMKVGGATCGSFNGGSKKLAVRGSKLARNGGVQEKCAQGPASKSSGPSLSCGSETKPFSVNQMQVSVDKDTDVHFVYGYDNGQQCHHTVSCKAGQQNSVQNTQCGGATSVQCQVAPNSPHEECNVGIHSVGFDCSPCSSETASLPVASSPPASVPNSPQSPPASVPSVPASSSVPYPSVPLSTGPSSNAMIPSVPVASSVPVPLSTGPSSNAMIPSVPATSSPSSNAAIPSLPVASSSAGYANSSVSASSPNSPQTPTAPGSTVPLVTTEVVLTTVTSCPVTTTHTSGTKSSVEVYQTESTVLITSTITVCTRCVAPPKTPETSAPPASTPNSPQRPPASSAPAPASSAPAPASSAPASSVAPVSSANSPEQPSSSAAPAPPGTTQEVVTTEVVYTTITSCPVTATVTSAGVPHAVVTQSVSTILSTSVITVCTKCVAPPASSAPASVPNSPQQPSSAAPVSSVAPSAPAAPAPSAPGVLPSCLKTWLQLTKCKNNADSDCFCKDSSFTSSVQQCVSSWSAGKDEEQAALSYLAGICAPHVSANPGIVANVPSTITLLPTPPATSNAPAAPVTSAPVSSPASVANSPQQASVAPAGSVTVAPTAAPAGPVTTISISTTITLPCPSAGGAVSQITDGQIQAPTSMAPGACTTTSVVNTAVTVPQVYISSGPSATSLAAGTPAPAAASATPATSVALAAGAASGTASSVPVPTSTSNTTPFTGAAGKVEGSMVMSIIVAAIGFAFVA